MKNRGEAKGGSRENKNKWKRIQGREIPKQEIYLSNLYCILDYQSWRNHFT
jgi:hypothetical protein